MREAFGPRARALGVAPRPDEGADDQLIRRSLLRVVGPEDATLAAQARSLADAWLQDRAAIDPGLVDVVLVTAARAGDAGLFDRMLAAARTGTDRLERRSLMMALFSFDDPAVSARGLALLLDPAFDVRETWTALANVHGWNPARAATYRYIVAHFDALAATVSRDAPGHWPSIASGLCLAPDLAEVEAFWRPRAAALPGAERELALAVESIGLCIRLRERGMRPARRG